MKRITKFCSVKDQYVVQLPLRYFNGARGFYIFGDAEIQISAESHVLFSGQLNELIKIQNDLMKTNFLGLVYIPTGKIQEHHIRVYSGQITIYEVWE